VFFEHAYDPDHAPMSMIPIDKNGDLNPIVQAMKGSSNWMQAMSYLLQK
jgi:hypothetical protein